MVKNNKKGFTIIEVVLVLAIAGLIFLMVFIALPALQRSQRNTQRKNDLSRFVTAVTSYQSNNSNTLPSGNTMNTDLKTRYIIAGGDASQFQDPDGETYYFKVLGTPGTCTGSSCSVPVTLTFGVTTETIGTTSYTGHMIVMVKNSKCAADEGKVAYIEGKNNFSLVMPLEGNSIACADNQ